MGAGFVTQANHLSYASTHARRHGTPVFIWVYRAPTHPVCVRKQPVLCALGLWEKKIPWYMASVTEQQSKVFSYSNNPHTYQWENVSRQTHKGSSLGTRKKERCHKDHSCSNNKKTRKVAKNAETFVRSLCKKLPNRWFVLVFHEVRHFLLKGWWKHRNFKVYPKIC